ncbi:MAG: rhodanese-like domain-containing protein [Chromatiales bacterium]|nr:rhodanese-like domain-containing protein [Chromatiales bacterium]
MIEVNISCSEAREKVQAGAQLVDVRMPHEFMMGALPEASNLPLQYFHAADEHLDRDRPVILYCNSGARSHQAMSYLRSRGYGEVYNLGSFMNYMQC